MKYSNFLLFSLSIVFSTHPITPTLDIPTMLEQAAQGRTIALKQVTLLQDMPFSPGLKKFLNTIILVTPVVTDEPNPQAYQTDFTFITGVKTIAAQATVEGVMVDVSVCIFDQSDGQKISVSVHLPHGFSYAQWEPPLAAFRDLVISDAYLIYAQDAYYDPHLALTVNAGATFQLAVQGEGKIKELLSHLGISRDVLTVAGTVRSGLMGSSLSCTLGDMVLPLGDNGGIGNAHGLSLVLTLIEMLPHVPGISVAIQGNLLVTLPWQSQPLAMVGEVKYISPTLLSVSGWLGTNNLYGPPAFGIPGLALGEFGLSCGMDVAEASTTSGLLSLAEVGYTGSIMLGATKVLLQGQLNYSNNPNFLMEGSVTNINVKDFIVFGAKILDLVEGQNSHLAQAVQRTVPPIDVDQATVYVIPKDTTFLGAYYEKGIQSILKTRIANVHTDLTVRVNEQNIQGSGLIKGLQFGSLKIIGDPHGGTPSDAALVSLTFSAQPLRAAFFIDGGMQLDDVLGGIIGAATLSFSLGGFNCHTQTEICKRFAADIHIAGTFTGSLSNLIIQDSRLGISVWLQQEGLKKFSQEVKSNTITFHQQAAQIKELQRQRRDLQRKITEKQKYIMALAQANIDGADPRMVQAHIDLGILKVALANVQALIATTTWNEQVLEDLSDISAYLMRHGITIDCLEFHATVADLKVGKLPSVSIEFFIEGKPICIECEVDFNNMQQTIVVLLQAIEQAIGAIPIS